MKYIYQEELSNPKSFSGEKVLLVDDNKINLKVTKLLLEDSGVSVDAAMSGEEAVDMYRQSEQNYYRIIFMDINMYGMNGYDTTRLIRNMKREDSKSIPIFAMSADILEIHKERAKEAGMNGYVMKPFAFREVFSLMHHVFGADKEEV